MNEKEPKKLDLETYFLMSQEDIYKIDHLIGALNLAIGEILEARPVKSKLFEPIPHQWEYDRQISEIIYKEDPIDLY